MGIKYFVNNLNWIFKNQTRACVLHVSVARRENHIHVADVTSLENSEEILAVIMHEWRKYTDHFTHEVVSSRLIHGLLLSRVYIL